MRAAAEALVQIASESISRRGRFDWALAGGKTPEQLYALLATSAYAARVDWAKVHFYWGDERCVPPEHPDSNYRMARAALLDAVRPPDANVHRMLGELPPEVAAERHEAELRRSLRLAGGIPTFDLLLLGMGSDGHTASLFPGSPALDETRRWVVADRVAALDSTRLTLTLPVLEAAEHVIFLVAGADKAARVEQVLSRSSPSLPAARVRPRSREACWLLDAEAGARLEGAA